MTSRLCQAVAIPVLLSLPIAATAAGDPKRGAQEFRQCAVCHSTRTGVEMTGPSLAHVWGRKAASEAGFNRYSDALKSSGLTWNAATLNEWLTDPAKFIPGNTMPFAGIRDSEARQDIIAYLRVVDERKAPALGRGTMAGGTRGRGANPSLKSPPPDGQVTGISYCRDTYTIKTADGQTYKLWEFNLRFKTDSSPDGPLAGKPVIMNSGMRGDRVFVIFASPVEISKVIKESCE